MPKVHIYLYFLRQNRLIRDIAISRDKSYNQSNLKRMKKYELLYILPASETSEEIVKNFNDVQKHIEKYGGKMLETLLDHPFLTKTGMSKDEESDEIKALPVVKRKLAYPIKHEKFGFYCLVNFEAEGKKIEDIDEYLRLHSKSLRHIIIEADPMTKEELELLQTLFARKKAEQDKEEAERESRIKEEPRRVIRREEPVEKPAEEKSEKIEKVGDLPEITVEEKKEEKVKESKKETEKEKESEKEDKKAGKKSKIKLEELEDKLDEILEDTIV